MSKYSENMPPSLRDAIGWMYDYIEPNKTFLDFGCSTGYFGKLIKEAKNNKVYGVEISDDIIEARKVLDGVYSFDLDGKWPEKIYERKYDYLFFGDVIEHLKDPQKALEKCKELLKKDGLLFISTPNVAHISIRLELLGGNFEYESMGILDNTHLKYFTKSSLTQLVADAGYNLKSIDITPNDYPDTVITEWLDKLGLEANEKFWKIVNSPEARAFQYKLVLEKPDGTKKPNESFRKLPTKPEIVRNSLVNERNENEKILRHHADEQAKIIEHYAKINKELEHRNQILEKRMKRLDKLNVVRLTKSSIRHLKRKD